jgi:peptidyl-prolyl cis-trans isomerase A (cyclophilin A)
MMLRALPALALALTLGGCGDADRCGGSPPAPTVPDGHALRNPDDTRLKVVPPDSFDARFETTKGVITVRLYREWAPLGVYRFYNLARNGYYDGSRFFRVLPGFVAQFGMSGRPEIDAIWNEQQLPDDPRRVSNRAGTLVYATAGPDTRTTQLFFNFSDNYALDEQNFAPIGRVVDGAGALFLLEGGYGDTPPQGTGPYFGCILSHGNQYLDRRYPRLDRIDRITLEEPRETDGTATP